MHAPLLHPLFPLLFSQNELGGKRLSKEESVCLLRGTLTPPRDQGGEIALTTTLSAPTSAQAQTRPFQPRRLHLQKR